MIGRRWFDNIIVDAAAKGAVGGFGIGVLGVPIPFVLAAIKHTDTDEAGIIAGSMVLMATVGGLLYGTALGCWSYYRQDALGQFGLFGHQPLNELLIEMPQVRLLPRGPIGPAAA